MLIYIPFIYFTGLLIYKWRQQRSFNVGSVITLYYLISALFSIVVKQNDYWPYGPFPTLTIIPTILYCGLLTFAIIPFYNLRPETIEKIEPINEKRFKTISWILIAFTSASLAFNFNEIVGSLQSGFAASMSGFSDIRGEFYDSVSDNVGGEGMQLSAAQYLINFAPAFSPIMLLFFFYSITFMKNSKVMNLLLFLSSLVIVLQSFVSASRTQSIYWLMTIIPIYMFFRPFIKEKTKWVINGLIGLLVSTMAIYFVAVSISRFEDRNTGTNGYLAYYAGQTYPHFVNVWDHYTYDGITVDRLLPITSKYILRNKFDRTLYREREGQRIGAPVNIFFTFLGDALIDFGVVGMFIYLIIFVMICKRCMKSFIRSVTLSHLIIYVLLIRQIALGLFAYVYTSINASILIIGSIYISYLLKKNNSL